jgi:hypothetical protein
MCSSQTLQKKDPKSLYEALLKIKEGNVLQYLSSFPLTAPPFIPIPLEKADIMV